MNGLLPDTEPGMMKLVCYDPPPQDAGSERHRAWERADRFDGRANQHAAEARRWWERIAWFWDWYDEEPSCAYERIAALRAETDAAWAAEHGYEDVRDAWEELVFSVRNLVRSALVRLATAYVDHLTPATDHHHEAVRLREEARRLRRASGVRREERIELRDWTEVATYDTLVIEEENVMDRELAMVGSCHE